MFQDVVDVLVSPQIFPPRLLLGSEGLVAQIPNLLGARIELAQLGFGLVARTNLFLRDMADAFGVADELVENLGLSACLLGPERLGVANEAHSVKEVHASLERLLGRHELFLPEPGKILDLELNRSIGLPVGLVVAGKPFSRPNEVCFGQRTYRKAPPPREELVGNDPVCRGYRR